MSWKTTLPASSEMSVMGTAMGRLKESPARSPLFSSCRQRG